MPAQATENNNANVVNAATEVIDGVTYETIYLTGDDAANLNKISACNNAKGNYRFVLQNDWVSKEDYVIFSGSSSIILDLNGCHLGTIPRYSVSNVIITDSSPANTGSTKSWVAVCDNVQTLSIYGGTYPSGSFIDAYCNVNVVVYGGNWSVSSKFGLVFGETGFKPTYTIKPWVKINYSNTGSLESLVSPDYFVISTSSNISGYYNYEFNYSRADLRAFELANLAISQNQTFFLWGRDADGAYEYLNIVYRDGEWRNAAQK